MSFAPYDAGGVGEACFVLSVGTHTSVNSRVEGAVYPPEAWPPGLLDDRRTLTSMLVTSFTPTWCKRSTRSFSRTTWIERGSWPGGALSGIS